MQKKENNLSILSKHTGWMTVSSKTKNRRFSLEKERVTNLGQNSKLSPTWMESNAKNNKAPELFRAAQYNDAVKQKSKKMMILVDKALNSNKLKPIDINPNRSVFNLDDFNHNVITKIESDYYTSRVSQLPRKFFDWDDGKKFNPKYKKDV